ncbi:uncharacterized protein BX664DRAFT_138652 [Halteromyces radiatus]|uniref:uncharacterized protein n=1 Tax=Halteromyces radiatus TaxID=101107 RepID=UPI00221E457D|nr:uncharacterized protein BX664DRAFT_138652 [Halteromyces radiatus]KAI8089637.1 hypothetical protein BX664DRAFT_138652 [Halteromyces radiatus]
MTDDFCFALLRSTTLQILQSVGFESVQLSSADTLTDVFGQYIEFLASTVCEYAHLSGRATGNSFDVMDGLSELSIDIKTLENWLELEGKDFTPAWTDQSDPSCALEGVIDVRRKKSEKPFIYEYLNKEELNNCTIETLNTDDDEITTDKSVSSKTTTTTLSTLPETSLPNYVPSYLPAFPKMNLLNKEEDGIDLYEKKGETLLSSSTSSINLSHPLTVKKKKKPITNPFTHITPFDESYIATDKDAPPLMALSALNTTTQSSSSSSSSELSHSLSAQRDIPLKRLMDAYEEEPQPQKQPVTRSLPHLFRQDTQDEASAGTRLFGRSSGLLGNMVRNVAPPLALSTLSTPNLMVDMVTTTGNLSSTNAEKSSSSTASSVSTSAAPNLITIPTLEALNQRKKQDKQEKKIKFKL